MTHSNKPKQDTFEAWLDKNKPTFRQWFEKKFKKQLPMYLENAQKKARMAEYNADMQANKALALDNVKSNTP
jgi:type III secretory pathway component EscR